MNHYRSERGIGGRSAACLPVGGYVRRPDFAKWVQSNVFCKPFRIHLKKRDAMT